MAICTEKGIKQEMGHGLEIGGGGCSEEVNFELRSERGESGTPKSGGRVTACAKVLRKKGVGHV